jgi:hypothetical protein
MTVPDVAGSSVRGRQDLLQFYFIVSLSRTTHQRLPSRKRCNESWLPRFHAVTLAPGGGTTPSRRSSARLASDNGQHRLK